MTDKPAGLDQHTAAYIVIPIDLGGAEERQAFENLLRDASHTVFWGFAPQFYATRYAGTSIDLSKELGFGEGSDPLRGVVLPLSRSYYGYAREDFWEWIEFYG